VIIPFEQLSQRLAAYGIRPRYSNSGRFDFEPGVQVQRRCLMAGPDASIRASLRPCCADLHTAEEVAAATAGHLAELGAAPLYLVPHVHWEHEMLDHCPEVWRQVLQLAGQPSDDPGLTGGNAVELEARGTPLAAMIRLLLQGLQQADALLLGELPLIVKVHHHRQVWFSSPDTALLPVLPEGARTA
jgi:hypothetical protein